MTLLALSAVAVGAVVVFGIALVVVKLALLPLRLAFGLVKVILAVALGGLLLLVGLPVAAIMVVPLLFVGVVAWGMFRLFAA